MSKVRLEFLSWLTDTLDVKGAGDGLILEQEIKDGNTVKELLMRVAAAYPRFSQTVFDIKSQKLSSGVRIFYNDCQLELVNGLETKLNDHDALIFVPVIAGG